MKKLLLILCLLAFTGVSAQISQTFKNVTINDTLKTGADSILPVRANLIPTNDSCLNLGTDSLRWDTLFVDVIDANVLDTITISGTITVADMAANTDLGDSIVSRDDSTGTLKVWKPVGHMVLKNDTNTVTGLFITQTPFASRTDSFLNKDAATDRVTATPYEQWVYQPIDSLQTNLDALTLDSAMYTRIGTLVTVSGVATVDPTAGAATSFYMSIPVASNMGTPFVSGNILAGNVTEGGTVTFGTTQKVLVQFLAADITTRTMTYTFTYRIQ